jgi:hypothetical protein
MNGDTCHIWTNHKVNKHQCITSYGQQLVASYKQINIHWNGHTSVTM